MWLLRENRLQLQRYQFCSSFSNHPSWSISVTTSQRWHYTSIYHTKVSCTMNSQATVYYRCLEFTSHLTCSYRMVHITKLFLITFKFFLSSIGSKYALLWLCRFPDAAVALVTPDPNDCATFKSEQNKNKISFKIFIVDSTYIRFRWRISTGFNEQNIPFRDLILSPLRVYIVMQQRTAKLRRRVEARPLLSELHMMQN
ncbi:hypothetical protein HW555_002951 [Spodoptera exigua]|uniref:Uncharacterized protein n=1 Tax=Spodoptera exigua TaxID=7107 RepID=A0A835GMW6_SPOEX|nr:hypothetical protein HW555_002951 [Spodoptera exigua]